MACNSALLGARTRPLMIWLRRADDIPMFRANAPLLPIPNVSRSTRIAWGSGSSRVSAYWDRVTHQRLQMRDLSLWGGRIQGIRLGVV
jgi:hypothetical protein